MFRLILVVIAAVFFSMPALAQQQPAFVPFTIDQETYNQITTYLGEVPSKYANPLLVTLGQKEQAAAKAKAEADAKAATEKPKK